jgi:lambda family phage portal protein
MPRNKALLGKLADRGILSASEAVRYGDAPVINPGAQAVRHALRRPTAKRSYDAANVDNLTASWTTSSLTADEVVARVLTPVRARVRDQVANNDYAKHFIRMAKSHVVGADGFRFQGRTVGRDGQQDEIANNALEKAWKDWGRARNCDSTQKQSFAEMCRLWIATVATDGEVLIRRRLGPEFGPYQYALQLIDPELLDVTYNVEDRNGRLIRHGIEFDSNGRPVRYYLRGDPATARSYYSGNAQHVVIPASEIFHGFLVERIGQKRGIPWLATSGLRMMMLNGFENAALVNARYGASKMGFYLMDDDATLTPEQLAARMSTDQEDGEYIDQIEAGVFSVAPPGVKDIKAFDAAYPNGEFGPFTGRLLQGIGAGLGVSSHKFANDYAGMNYSSAKMAELEERELWKALQSWMVESFLRPLYEDWLAWQLRLGNIEVPTRTGPRPLYADQFDKYTAVHFQGRRWQFNEPLKEEQARKLGLDNFMRSPLRELQDQGLDPDEVVRDFVRWRDMLYAAGFQMPAAAGVTMELNNAESDQEVDAQD